MVQEAQHHPIDAVITWVDGLDPAHLKKRKSVMVQRQICFMKMP